MSFAIIVSFGVFSEITRSDSFEVLFQVIGLVSQGLRYTSVGMIEEANILAQRLM